MNPLTEQQVNSLIASIKGHQIVTESLAERLRTPEIIDSFDKFNHESWCLSVAGDSLVRLGLFIAQNFNFVETMGTISVARYIFELSVWLNLFKLDTRYGLVYYAQLLETQYKYWKDNRAQIDREIELLQYFEKTEKDAQNDVFNRIKELSDPEEQKALLANAKGGSDIIDKHASRQFSIYVEQAKINGYGFQAHLLEEKLLPQIEKSIADIDSEKALFDTTVQQDIKDLIPKRWQWRQMAGKVNLTDEYDYIYAFSSKLLHATPASITTDQKNLELVELVIFLKYIDVKIMDLIELANEYAPVSA